MTRTEKILQNRHGGAYSRAIPKEKDMLFDFDGETYDKVRDQSRLGEQMLAVYSLMKDGRERTLQEISDALGYPESSVSARLRDMRKPRFGGYTVERSYVRKGLWSYRVAA